MNFLSFILMVGVGYVFLHTKNFMAQLLGVVLLVVAFNPVSKMITGRSIPANVQMAWHAGENLYNKIHN